MAATAFPAAAIVSGTIATSRLGSGTADATSFLRGDSTWAAVESSVLPLILGTNIVEQYNGTTGQKARWFKTRTSSTVFEGLEVDAATDASNFDLVALRGSVGGAERGIRIGGRQDGGSFVPWVSIDTAGLAYGVGFTTVASGIGTERFGRNAAPNATNVNTAMGQEAGINLTTGSANVFVGLAAGQGVTTGNDNTIIGQQSGTTAGGLSGSCLVGRSQIVTAAVSTVIGIGAAQTIGHHDAICLGTFAFTSKAGQATFGRRIDCLSFQGLFSDAVDRHVCEIQKVIVDSADATRKGRMSLHAYDANGLREGLRVEATGTVSAIGFLGANAVIRQTASAAATDAATTQTLVNEIRTALINYGLLT